MRPGANYCGGVTDQRRSNAHLRTSRPRGRSGFGIRVRRLLEARKRARAPPPTPGPHPFALGRTSSGHRPATSRWRFEGARRRHRRHRGPGSRALSAIEAATAAYGGGARARRSRVDPRCRRGRRGRVSRPPEAPHPAQPSPFCAAAARPSGWAPATCGGPHARRPTSLWRWVCDSAGELACATPAQGRPQRQLRLMAGAVRRGLPGPPPPRPIAVVIADPWRTQPVRQRISPASKPQRNSRPDHPTPQPTCAVRRSGRTGGPSPGAGPGPRVLGLRQEGGGGRGERDRGRRVPRLCRPVQRSTGCPLRTRPPPVPRVAATVGAGGFGLGRVAGRTRATMSAAGLASTPRPTP